MSPETPEDPVMGWKKPDPLTPEQEERQKEPEQIHVDWKDRLAMVVSAFLVLGLPAVLILLALCFLVLALFGVL